MQLIFHGGAQEVGRSCIEVRTGRDRYLLDCGVKFHARGMDYPAKVFDIRTVDAVFLSHAHLDHSGGLPFFEHYRMSCPIFGNKETKEIVKVLLKDSHKVARIKSICDPYLNMDVDKAIKDVRAVPYNKEIKFRDIAYTYFNAGHIPGSSCIKIAAEGMRLLYSGDFNPVETDLMQPAAPAEWGRVDILITEATYGVKDHPERTALKRDFVKKAKEVVARGGRVLIPVFAVGRAQEVLLMLADEKWDVPIYLDGMARKITRIVMNGPSPYVKHKDKLKELYKRIKLVKSQRQRETIADEKGIFVTTSGMLQGGPVLSYMDHIVNDKKSAVLLSGFQVHGTRGWHLSEEGTWRDGGKNTKAACEIARFDFSAHVARSHIQKTILAKKPKIVIFNHGDPSAIAAMTAWAQRNTTALVYAPSVGDQIDIDDSVSHIHAYTADDGYAFPAEHQHGDTCVQGNEILFAEDD